ncbi:MAG: UvrD-helicase domain-containing protein [Elusimicrobiota bacterium]|jgi:DNA helicase-2/ATP-dependent DNA helicase PcrA|nr:UvrD-helicase domain-containing protein [Elusimicrobiota bacterium]
MNSIDKILSTLNPKQLEAVLYNSGPCLIIAGAGTGKTKTLTCKIAKLIADGMMPNRILAVTFTNKAAKEMRERVDALVPGQAARVWVNTFHSFAVRVLRQNYEAASLDRDFVIYDESEQKKIITLVLEEMGLKDAKREINYYISTISRAKDDMLDPESFYIHAQTSNNPKRQQVAEIYRRYQRKLIAAAALDFGDLLMKVVDLLKNNEAVRNYYQEYFQYVLVDEYQDTNHTQYSLVRMLAEKHRKLCVVGDPDQSIYSWRGANIRNILEFERDFKNAKVITLEQNYRSTQVILDASNKLIKKNKNRREKSLFTEQKSGEPVNLMELATEGEEARWTANQIQTLVEEDGINLNDVAVFYRTNAQSRNFEDTFRRYQIPYRLIGAVRFYERKEIKDILSYAKLLVNPNDTVSLLRVINTPRRGLGESAQQSLIAHSNQENISLYKALKSNVFVDGLKPTARRGAREFINLIEGLTLDLKMSPPSDTLLKIMELSGYKQSLELESEKDPEAASRIGNLNELINAVKEYETRSLEDEVEPTLSGYLQEVSLIGGADEEKKGQSSDSGAVTLMTVHLAKGLEFPVVFVSGLEEGLFPLLGGRDDEDLEEERRLCYVAMTRAKKKLNMSYCATRRIFGKTYSNLASRFLFDSGLMHTEEFPEGGMRREIDSFNRKNHWTPKNSVSYNNAANYKDTIPMSQMRYEQASVNTPNIQSQNGQEGQASQDIPAKRATGVKVGSQVRHGVFGVGKVILVSGSGEATKISVVFAGGTKRVFMLQYAPLEIL